MYGAIFSEDMLARVLNIFKSLLNTILGASSLNAESENSKCYFSVNKPPKHSKVKK